MRRFIRCAFVSLLAVALVASGSLLGVVSYAAQHGHDAGAGLHAHHDHAQHEHSAAPDDTPQQSQDHASKTCCSMCTVASPLPPTLCAFPTFKVSPTQYVSRSVLGIALRVPVDP